MFAAYGLFITINVRAEEAIPEIVLVMQKDIKGNQIFVKEYEKPIMEAKANVKTRRQFICENYKDYCTKEYLDPADSGTDISSFLAIPRR